LHNLSSFYEKHPPGIQLSKKGTPLPKDRTPLPNPSKDLDSNKNFDSNKYKIILYLTKGLIYNMLASLVTSGDNLVAILSVFNTESITNQTLIYKIIETPKL
jgi:hypothetical protein